MDVHRGFFLSDQAPIAIERFLELLCSRPQNSLANNLRFVIIPVAHMHPLLRLDNSQGPSTLRPSDQGWQQRKGPLRGGAYRG